MADWDAVGKSYGQRTLGSSQQPIGGRIARVLFCVDEDSMILLHGFIKKTQQTPAKELDLALKRMKGTKV